MCIPGCTPSQSNSTNSCNSSTGSCPTKLTAIKLVSLTFLSDHAVLKDYDTDWKDGGSLFTKPDWTPARQNKVSHTMDKEVKIKLELAIEPSGAPTEIGDIRGVGPNGMVFEKKGVSFAPGSMTIELTSSSKLDKTIQELDFRISWATTSTSVSISPSTTANVMFVTMDTPTTPPGIPGITSKRMRKAINAAAAAASLDPHAIVKKVFDTWGNFNVHVAYTDNPWLLAQDKRKPDGSLEGADCQTIVRYTNAVIKMIGCPGKAEPIVVWAKVPTPTHGEENDWPSPNVRDPKQWWSSFRPPDPAKARVRATLVDYSGDTNKYEACLRFTHPESGPSMKKKYYAGGVGVFDNADQVIKVFKHMAWIDEDTGAIVGIIYDYEHNRPGP